MQSFPINKCRHKTIYNRFLTWASAFMLCLSSALTFADTPIPQAPQFEAKSYVMLDYASGMVLAAKDADAKVEPASITKLMTAYVVYKALANKDISLQDEVAISEGAWRSSGSRMFIEVGTKVHAEDLLWGLIIQSGNDASIALTEHVAGTESAFADLMNAEAKRLGLKNTNFVNSTGLPDPNHYSTAHDIALLSQAIIRDYPEEYKRYSVKEFTYNGIKQYNRNRLLWRKDGVDGLKTGHTETAWYCLAASAQREDMRLITVIMGADTEQSRTVNTQALLNYGFRFYESHKLYKKGDALVEHRVWMGKSKQIPLGAEQDLYVTVPRGKYDQLKVSLDVASKIIAPVPQGQKVGMINIAFDGKAYTQAPLVTLRAMNKGGYMRRATDFVLQYFD